MATTLVGGEGDAEFNNANRVRKVFICIVPRTVKLAEASDGLPLATVQV